MNKMAHIAQDQSRMGPAHKLSYTVLVTGSTLWSNSIMIETLLNQAYRVEEGKTTPFRILTGMAKGADTVARNWARRNDIQCLAEDIGRRPSPELVKAYNRKHLAHKPDLVLAFKMNFDPNWHLETCDYGTEHMCRIAAKAGIPVLLNSVTDLRQRFYKEAI